MAITSVARAFLQRLTHFSFFYVHPTRSYYNMGLITLVQGFKLGVSEFDGFLIANKLPSLGGGYQPSCEEAEDIAKLFRAQGIDCEVKIFVPYVTGFNRSHDLFVCCDWIHVLATLEIKDVLQKPVPPAFEAMRKSFQAKSGVSTYVVYNDEDEFSYIPEEMIKRNTVHYLL